MTTITTGLTSHKLRTTSGVVADGKHQKDSNDMARLVNGKLQGHWRDATQRAGEFVRVASPFRDWVTADRAGRFPAEPGRYHLYVSLACPWAHRTLILRKLKQLEDVITVSVVDPVSGDDGWRFSDAPGCTPDALYGSSHLHQLYTRARADFTGLVTVPVLWDRRTETIVNNESPEIIRMLNSAFDAFTPVRADYYPEALRPEIDAINEFVYERINNGVYRCGFAGTQAVYDRAFDALFGALDEIEARLATSRFLVGNTLTEADWRLFPTLLRFDAVYYSLFRCNRHRMVDFPNLSSYLRDLYQRPGIAETVDFDHIKHHYFLSLRQLNPSGIVPNGPALDFDAPHDRGRFGPVQVAQRATSP
jgi:putative glutathione S-transferase